jgi:hypothetical protein
MSDASDGSPLLKVQGSSKLAFGATTAALVALASGGTAVLVTHATRGSSPTSLPAGALPLDPGLGGDSIVIGTVGGTTPAQPVQQPTAPSVDPTEQAIADALGQRPQPGKRTLTAPLLPVPTPTPTPSVSPPPIVTPPAPVPTPVVTSPPEPDPGTTPGTGGRPPMGNGGGGKGPLGGGGTVPGGTGTDGNGNNGNNGNGGDPDPIPTDPPVITPPPVPDGPVLVDPENPSATLPPGHARHRHHGHDRPRVAVGNGHTLGSSGRGRSWTKPLHPKGRHAR